MFLRVPPHWEEQIGCVCGRGWGTHDPYSGDWVSGSLPRFLLGIGANYFQQLSTIQDSAINNMGGGRNLLLLFPNGLGLCLPRWRPPLVKTAFHISFRLWLTGLFWYKTVSEQEFCFPVCPKNKIANLDLELSDFCCWQPAEGAEDACVVLVVPLIKWVTNVIPTQTYKNVVASQKCSYEPFFLVDFFFKGRTSSWISLRSLSWTTPLNSGR